MIIIGNYWLLAVARCLSVWGLLFFLILWRCSVASLPDQFVCVCYAWFLLRKTSGTHAYFNRKNEHLNGTKQNASRTELRDIEKRRAVTESEPESKRKRVCARNMHCRIQVGVLLIYFTISNGRQGKRVKNKRESQHVVCVVDCVLLRSIHAIWNSFTVSFRLAVQFSSGIYRFIQCIKRIHNT